MPISPEALPRSPIEFATELIATSGVWRNKEQYLVTLFLLQPLEFVWQEALRDGLVDKLKQPEGLAQIAKGMDVRSVFLHGPGGSGKTYCMTEVVVKTIRHFLGRRGVKAIAAHNSAARLLLGKTMHAAGKMTRQQSLKAKALKPNARARKALEKEWQDLFFLLADEVSLG